MPRQPLILVPGVLLTRDLWRDQIPALADIADPVVTLEHTRHESIAAIAGAILAAAPPRFALAGLSMGGYIVLEMMRQAPERVTRLALLDTSARPDTAAQTEQRRELLDLAKIGKFKGVTARLLPSFVHASRAADMVLLGRLQAMAEEVGQAGFARQQAAIIARPDSRPSLSAIAVPTLVLCGRQDERTPLFLSEEMAAAIPGAHLAVIEECGHLPPMEQPEAVNAALRAWLAG